MENMLDFFEAYCIVCNRRQKTKDMYLCEYCNEPVCESDSEEVDNDTRYCKDCIALSKLAKEVGED